MSQQLISFVFLFFSLQCVATFADAASVAVPNYAANSSTDDTNEAKSLCRPNLWQFNLQIPTALEPNELVGLTGESKALGAWKLERSLALNRINAQEWSTSVVLQLCTPVKYRYFIYTQDMNGKKQIRRWETQLQPRQLDAFSSMSLHVNDRFGEVKTSGCAAAGQVKRGWLSNEYIIQLQFEREKLFQVYDIEKFDPDNVYIKVVPVKNADLETALDLGEQGINVEVVKMQYALSQLQPQKSLGISYKRGDVVIFHITAPQLTDVAYALVFHNAEEQPIGKAIITSSQLMGSEGVLVLNVTEPSRTAATTIAQLTLPYLIVKPFTDITLDFRTTFAHYWPKSWPNLHVGHRGNGKSYIAEPPAERENTIASFISAYEHHADMVEFDVHLTADGVPVIYHDFGLRTAPKGKNITKDSQLEYVLIKDVSYEMLKDLRVFAIINQKIVEYPSHNAESRIEHRLFPTLLDLLEGLPKTLGMDVEIKWPQLRKGGSPEAAQTIDKNYFVDRVLNTVITNGLGRPLIFSSFDADICTMLRFKQNLFPVMFLTMGETKKWEQLMDLRTRSVEQAINNAQAFELAGTAPHAEDFLDRKVGVELIQKARNLGQIVVAWGDDCNSKERVEFFRDIGATATCYDRSDLYMPADKQTAFFNSTILQEKFEEQCNL